MLWIDKYAPKKFRELKFNENAHLKVLKYLKTFKKGTKPLLIIGPPGIGKSSLIKIIANQNSYNLIFLSKPENKNYSDFSIFGKRNLIVYDEIVPIKNFNKTEFSVTLTTEYVKNCEKNFEVIYLNSECDYEYFRKILLVENIICDRIWLENVLEEMAGDHRSALNFLQLVSPLLKRKRKIKFEKIRNLSPFHHLKNIEKKRYQKKNYLNYLEEIHSPILLSLAYNTFNSHSIHNFLKFSEMLSMTDNLREYQFIVYCHYQNKNTQTEIKLNNENNSFFSTEISPFLEYFPKKLASYVSEDVYKYYKSINDFYTKFYGIKVFDELPGIYKLNKNKEFIYKFKPGISCAVKKIVKMKDLLDK
ncbi:Replication factor C large subunit [Dictyocoela muelleri]|nr:Replication factor C large subunit [Dictyocoela muelleri]